MAQGDGSGVLTEKGWLVTEDVRPDFLMRDIEATERLLKMVKKVYADNDRLKDIILKKDMNQGTDREKLAAAEEKLEKTKMDAKKRIAELQTALKTSQEDLTAGRVDLHNANELIKELNGKISLLRKTIEEVKA